MSLKFNLELLKPRIVIIQETKIKRKSQIKLEGYQSFPTVPGDSGGGLLLACVYSLNPVLLFEGDCETEVIAIEVVVGLKTLRVIAGYDPKNVPLLWCVKNTEVLLRSK